MNPFNGDAMNTDSPREPSSRDADAPPAPPPAGPFFATWGPLDGPILRSHEPPALGIVAAPDATWPIGIAFAAGQVQHRRGVAATFRLVLDQQELEGRWLCVGREFVRLGDAAEEL
jgi:hypothetical protein